MLKTKIPVVILMLALVMAACGSPAAPSPVTQAPTSPVTTKAPAPDTPSSATTAKLYADNCAVCHGAKREGGLGPSLDPQRLSGIAEATLSDVILNGRPNTAMASFKNLGDEQINALVQFIKNIAP